MDLLTSIQWGCWENMVEPRLLKVLEQKDASHSHAMVMVWSDSTGTKFPTPKSH